MFQSTLLLFIEMKKDIYKIINDNNIITDKMIRKTIILKCYKCKIVQLGIINMSILPIHDKVVIVLGFV